MNYSSRLARPRRALRKSKADSLIVSDLTNVRYLCGYTGSAGMVVVAPGRAFFLTDFRYQSQAAQQVPSDYKIVIAKKGLWREAVRLLQKHHLHHAAFEAEHLSVATWEAVQKQLKGKAHLVSTQRLVEDARLHKDDEELAIMQRAIDLIDEVFESICGVLKPGMREIEVADELAHQMKIRGASGTSFDSIVASGVRGALPHGVASDKKLARGEMVTIDMGAVLDGYCSDFTRTVCLGKPTAEQQKIYETVWLAQTEAAAQLRPGLKCVEADKIARKIIDDAGHSEQFGHGLGHGVGMQIHEAPRLSPLGKGRLEPGMVVSCEPGIYIPDWGGVRIEDLILITESGSKVLSKGAKPRKIMQV